MHFITSRLQLLVGLFLVCLSVSCIRDGEPSVSSATLEVGEQVPEFSVVLNSGESLANTDLKGRVSVLVFFVLLAPTVVKNFLRYNVCTMLSGMIPASVFIASAGKIIRKK